MAEIKTEKIRLGTGDLTVSPYSTLSSGTAIPSNGDGNDGDIYVRVAGTSSEIYIKKSGVWIPAGSGNSGTGGDYGLDSLVYNASFADDFSSATNSATDGIQTSITRATHNAGQYYTISYDAFDGITKTITGVGTSITLSAAPAFTVQTGDVVIFNNEARKIITVTTQQSYTIESAFTSNPTAAAGTISQTVHTVDLNNYNNGGTEAAVSQVYTGSINDLVLNYNDSSSGNIPDTTSNPKVSFTASASGVPSDYTLVVSRSGLTTTKQIVSLPTANTSLYLRFFAAPSLSGSGTVNLLNYEAFFHNSAVTISGGFALNQAYCFTDSSTTPINCNQPTVVSSKTTITGLPAYTIGVNPNTTNGQLEVFINGQKIPRYVAGSTNLSDAFYNEITTDTIELDSDYSGYNYSVEVIRPTNVIDISNQAVQLSNPIGTVLTYAGTSAPTGYLLCQGQTLNTSTNPEYSALYNVIATAYGGTGPTNFKLPDIQGRSVLGAGTGAGLSPRVLAATGGAETHTLSTNEMPSHDHRTAWTSDNLGGAGSYLTVGYGGGTAASTYAYGTRPNTEATGGGTAHNNMQPYLVLNYIIKY
jgi:microcystin-dependent protein